MRSRKRRAFALALIGLSGFGCTCGEPPACGPSEAKVVDVLDGDTLVIEGGEKVRYLLVNAPERSTRASDCYGNEARDANRQLVLNKTVALEYGPSCRDRFDRLLAYVTVEGREVNRLLVERGFACVQLVPPDGEDRVEAFEALEATARGEGRGLWGACDNAPCD